MWWRKEDQEFRVTLTHEHLSPAGLYESQNQIRTKELKIVDGAVFRGIGQGQERGSYTWRWERLKLLKQCLE